MLFGSQLESERPDSGARRASFDDDTVGVRQTRTCGKWGDRGDGPGRAQGRVAKSYTAEKLPIHAFENSHDGRQDH